MAGLQAGDLADGLLEPGGGAARGVQEAGSRAQDRILLASLRLQIFHSPGTMTMMRIMILDILFVNMKRKYNICTATMHQVFEWNQLDIEDYLLLRRQRTDMCRM